MKKEDISKSQANIFKIFPSPPPLPAARQALPGGERGSVRGRIPCLREAASAKAGEIRIALPLFSLIGQGFVDQHHRDIIFNRVEQVTGFAD